MPLGAASRLTILEVKLQLHHHITPLDRDVQQYVAVARWQRLEDAVLRAHDGHFPIGFLERQHGVVVIDQRMEYGA